MNNHEIDTEDRFKNPENYPQVGLICNRSFIKGEEEVIIKYRNLFPVPLKDEKVQPTD